MGSLHLITMLSYWILLSSLPKGFCLIGHGIEMYNPSCAFACRAAIASYPLTCSSPDDGHGGHGGHGGSSATTPACRASDTSFLQTLAWCMNVQCAAFDVEPWRLQKYWEAKATGDSAVIPKWTFSEAFHNITEVPERAVEEEGILNFTAVVDPKSWKAEKLSMEYFEEQEGLHARYGLVILLVGFALPIGCSLLRFVPFTSRLLQNVNRVITYPSTFRGYHIRPLPYSLGYAPTIGQGIYVAIFIILNIVLAAVSYRSTQPNTWFPNRYDEILAYVSCRTGVLAFAIAPLVVLFSSRNNVLLYVTNWSHSTYLILHRWTAWVFAAQTIVHSIAELILYYDDHASEAQKPYWIWGVVATMAMVIILPLSVLYVRRISYEIFLIGHIILAVFVLVGSWYHVELLFTRKWGYEFWLYAAFGVWIFDRLIRVMRMLKTGVRKSNVREVTENIVRIDIPGVRWGLQPGKHAYVFFPTLSLRPWENHPFSVIATALLSKTPPSSQVLASGTDSPPSEDIEKTAYIRSRDLDSLQVASSRVSTAGVTIFVRRAKGMTSRLQTRSNLPALLEGPYHSSHSSSILNTDRLILIAGGIGITGVIPFIHSHINPKLYWGCKESSSGLVHELDDALGTIVDKQILIGSRFDVMDLIEREAGSDALGVVVCGPAGMCDDVRQAVVVVGKKTKAVIELHAEAFSW